MQTGEIITLIHLYIVSNICVSVSCAVLQFMNISRLFLYWLYVLISNISHMAVILLFHDKLTNHEMLNSLYYVCLHSAIIYSVADHATCTFH